MIMALSGHYTTWHTLSPETEIICSEIFIYFINSETPGDVRQVQTACVADGWPGVRRGERPPPKFSITAEMPHHQQQAKTYLLS